MKILITTDTYTPTVNGVVFSVLLLKQELERLGHEVRVATLSKSHHSHREGEVYYLASLGAGKVYPDARVAVHKTRRFVEELLAWAPDVIHSQQEFSSFRLAHYLSKKGNIPIVHTYHTAYEDYTHYFSPSVRVGKKAVSLFTRKISGSVSCLIAPTRKIKVMLEGYGIHCPVEVIPTGVDLDAFGGSCDPAWKERTLAGLDIPRDRRVLVYLGRMAKEKGIDQLMDLLAQSGREDFVLLAVGDGPYKPKLEERAKDLPYLVVFTGAVPHEKIRDYYQLGDLFVTASTSETQGLTYFEALASGVPVLCRRDECVDGVIVDGVNGWQYDTPEEFRAALDTFCGQSGLPETLSQNARSTAERYSARAFGRAAEALYRRVAGQKIPAGVS